MIAEKHMSPTSKARRRLRSSSTSSGGSLARAVAESAEDKNALDTSVIVKDESNSTREKNNRSRKSVSTAQSHSLTDCEAAATCSTQRNGRHLPRMSPSKKMSSKTDGPIAESAPNVTTLPSPLKSGRKSTRRSTRDDEESSTDQPRRVSPDYPQSNEHNRDGAVKRKRKRRRNERTIEEVQSNLGEEESKPKTRAKKTRASAASSSNFDPKDDAKEEDVRIDDKRKNKASLTRKKDAKNNGTRIIIRLGKNQISRTGRVDEDAEQFPSQKLRQRDAEDGDNVNGPIGRPRKKRKRKVSSDMEDETKDDAKVKKEEKKLGRRPKKVKNQDVENNSTPGRRKKKRSNAASKKCSLPSTAISTTLGESSDLLTKKMRGGEEPEEYSSEEEADSVLHREEVKKRCAGAPKVGEKIAIKCPADPPYPAGWYSATVISVSWFTKDKSAPDKQNGYTAKVEWDGGGVEDVRNPNWRILGLEPDQRGHLSKRDAKLRPFLKHWVSRLRCLDRAEDRYKMRCQTKNTQPIVPMPLGQVQWIQCANPGCGKWRSLPRFLNSVTVLQSCNNTWYCCLNYWDDSLASCRAPQESGYVDPLLHIEGASKTKFCVEDTPEPKRLRFSDPGS